MNDLPNCWEIKQCGREKGGDNVTMHGECPTSQMDMGHSCWVVAGSFHTGEPYCQSVKEDGMRCSYCDVFKMYRRTGISSHGQIIREHFPAEEQRYVKMMSSRLFEDHM